MNTRDGLFCLVVGVASFTGALLVNQKTLDGVHELSRHWETHASQLSTPQALPDFSAIAQMPTKKEAFLAYLVPFVPKENERILVERNWMAKLSER